MNGAPDPVAIVDVGSNSVRLVVFAGAADTPVYLYNKKVLCGLGAGSTDSGRLNPEGRIRAMDALQTFAAVIADMGVRVVAGVATAAVREANDGVEFVNEVLNQTGIALRVISGVQEAEYSAKGGLLGWPDASGLVCDIGGASMELARISVGGIGACGTSALGPLKLLDHKGDVDAVIAQEINELLTVVGRSADRLFLVGGSWRAVARLDMGRRGHPVEDQHGYTLTASALHETIDWIATQSVEDLCPLAERSKGRLPLVPLAARVMAGLLQTVGPKQIIVSGYGLREGVWTEQTARINA